MDDVSISVCMKRLASSHIHKYRDRDNLVYSTLARLRESAEKRVWQQRCGVAVIYCHHSILCRRSREAPAANQRHYRDATLKACLPDLTFQSLCMRPDSGRIQNFCHNENPSLCPGEDMCEKRWRHSAEPG